MRGKIFFVLATAMLSNLVANSAYAEFEISGRRDYRQVRELLTQFQKENHTTSTLFTLGASDSGEEIMGLKVGKGPVKNLIVGTHHGNEYGSTEVALATAESLAMKPLADQTIFIVPVLNISGYNSRNREETLGQASFLRTILRTADPNRDYPGPCGTEGPFLLQSTRALAEFVERENIVAAATLHTFYGSVCYPWGVSSPDLRTPDEADFIQLANAAASSSSYEVGNSSEIMYPADGTFEDYVYWKHGTWSLLFEMGSTHSPSDRELKELVRVNVPGLRSMLEKAPRERSQSHAFDGRCDARFRRLDRRNE